MAKKIVSVVIRMVVLIMRLYSSDFSSLVYNN